MLLVIVNVVKSKDIILMVEVCEEVMYVKYYKKKIVFLFSVMCYFVKVL